MKQVLIFIFLINSLLGSAQGENSNAGFLRAEGKRIVDENGQNILLRGIGLGGYMLQEGYMLKVPFSGQQYVFKEHVQELIGKEKTEKFYDAWHSNFIQKSDIDSLKSWGFNSVRLPMHYNLYTLPVDQEPVPGRNTWLNKGFEMTDDLVNWCRDNDMYLILDMHAAPGGQGHDVNISDRDPSKPSLWESEANQEKLIALWEKLAQRYKDEPVIGAYDLINEPNWSFEEGKNINGVEDTRNVLIRALQVKITQAIREFDNNHIIIMAGNGWGNNYNGILPPWDENMVLSFHKYWSFNDQATIQQFLDFREQYNIPIWLGESGENSNAWFTDAIALMEENNIGWCWWPMKKLGSNNPVEIKMNHGYRDILRFWAENGKRPTEEAAFSAFMQLAENTKIENGIIHYDVIDAMMRQPHSKTIIAYKKIMISDTAEILAADYDLGNNGFAYKDNVSANYWVSTGKERESWNNGGIYRNDGVDIYRGDDEIYIGDTENGEWLQYTFMVKESGIYNLSFRASSSLEGGRAGVEINGINIQNIGIENTSNKWKWYELGEIELQDGKNKLKFKMLQGGFDFQKIRLERSY